MKKFRLISMLLALAMLFAGCGAGKKTDTASLLGVWVLTDMTGTEEDEAQVGWKVSMAISNDTLEMTTFDGTHSDYQAASYRIEGDKLITDASEMTYVLDGDTLKLTTGGITMVFTRK